MKQHLFPNVSETRSETLKKNPSLPEPLEKESHECLGSKRDDQFSNPFFEMVPKTC